MQRTRAWRRAQRKRAIRRRLNIVKNIWLEQPWPWLRDGARLAKYNLTCDSLMCKQNTFYVQREKRHREWVKHPLEDEGGLRPVLTVEQQVS